MRGPWLFHLFLVLAMVLAPAAPRTVVTIVDPSEEEHKERTESSTHAKERDDALLRRAVAAAKRPHTRPLIARTLHTQRLSITRTVDARAHRAGMSERRLI